MVRYLLLVLFMSNITLNSQNLEQFRSTNWRIFHQLNFADYIDINSNEWKRLSPQEKKSLMQIPENELKSLTTVALIEIHLNSAYTRSFFLFSEVGEYYNQLIHGFNGFNELINRPDVIDEIIKYYISMNPLEKNVNTAGVEMINQIQFIEYLIGSPYLVNKFNNSQLNLIIPELIKKYNLKSGNQQIVIESIESNIYALAQFLDNNKSFKYNVLNSIDGFVFLKNSGRMSNNTIASALINLSNNLIGK